MSKILGIGTDLCAISRIARAIEKPHFFERVYTETERAYLTAKADKVRAESAAAMFAAKEATAKALGTGFAQGIMPWQIEVAHEASGAPFLVLYDVAQERFLALGGQQMHLSLTHEQDQALAFVLLEK